VALALTTAIYIPTVAQQTAQATCGVWRWPVKTLSDPARTKVDFNPIGTQVKFLRSRARPGIPIGTNTPGVSRTEFHTWQVRARPIQAKVEDDGDIHLVISVPGAPSKTMIVEFPKKTCVASPFKRFRMSHARQQFLSNCGAVSSSSWLKLAGAVTITGVGFWDEKHGQTGIAPNGIELHPVLGFTGDATSPRPVAAEVGEVAAEPARLATPRASSTTVALITTATAKEATGLTSRSLVSPTALSVQILTASTGTTTGSAASSREQLGIGCLAFANCVSLVTGADSDE
jgi:hypothetical protein